jgi:hypothetical protein
MMANTVDTGVSERGSYEQAYVRQTDIIDWCKRWTLSATLSVGGKIFRMTPLVEIITLPRQQPSPSYTGQFMLLCCLMSLSLQQTNYILFGGIGLCEHCS